MLLILYSIFFLILILSLLISSKEIKWIIVILSCILFVVSAFRGPGVDRDYETYISALEGDNLSIAIFEPSFIFLSFIISKFLSGKSVFLFIIYAFIGVCLKMYALKRICNFYLFSLLLYVSYYFILHEMTQIRIGAACTFFLLSLPALYNRNKFKFFLLIFIAVLFHFSAIVLLFLWFLNPISFNKFKWIMALVISIFLGILFKPIITFIFESFDFGLFQYKILAYQNVNNSELNVFNVWVITRVLILSFLIYNCDFLERYNSSIYLYLKIYIISISFYYILSFNPAFAGRINDLFGIIEIILFPLIIYLITPKFIPKLVLYVVASMFLFLNLYYLKLIE